MTNQFLIKNTMADMRCLSTCEIMLLQSGCYVGVQLLGYYEKGDIPESTFYYLSNTVLGDDGGSVIEIDTIKLEFFQKVITLKHFGGVNDGNEANFTGTDNKIFIDRAVNYVSRVKGTLTIDGKYFHSPLSFTQSNFTLIIKTGSKLITVLPNEQDKQLTLTGGLDNVNILAYGAELIAPNTYTTGEWRHIVNINHVSNLRIEGLKASGGGGDGFYIGNFVEGQTPYRVILESTISDNNYRNGISVINGESIYLYNTLCQNIVGSSPQAGIDIEPNEETFELLKDIRVINPTTKNCAGYGVLFALASYVNKAEKSADVLVSNHRSFSDGIGFSAGGKGSGHPWNNKLSGYLNYSGAIFNSKSNGISISAFDVSKTPILNIDAYVENVGSGSDLNTEQNGMHIYAGGGSTFDVGNIKAKISVRDTRAVAKTYSDVYFSNQVKSIVNYDIDIDTDNRRTFSYGIFNSVLQDAKGLIKYTKKPVYSTNTALSVGNSVRGSGGIINVLSSMTVPLPSCVSFEGNIYQVNCSISNAIVLMPASGESIIIDGAKVNSLAMNKIGQYLELKATIKGWEIISSNFDKSSTTANRPVVTDGVLHWYDSTINKPIFWNGTTWVDIATV
ncbi:hypothetical protein [Sphingobacterium siyangense]|uniref:hypothetical protein n=1 Tax=Sphingobacterium siyangense TaxID=459529 RepID=UPI003DA314BA